MNTRILLLAISVVALSSCSVYRSGQTPDDVYYSPAPARQQARVNNNNNNDDSYVNVNQQKAGTNSNYQSYDQYQDSYRDDRFLRMSVGNPYYMSAYNSYGAFDWRYNSFYDGFNYGFGSPWNNYFAWNSFYNPYYGPSLGYGYGLGGGYYAGGGYYGSGGGIKTVSYTMPSRPVVFNVNSYTNNANRPVSRNYSSGNYNNSNQRYNNTNGNNRTNNTYYNNSNNNGRSTYTPANTNSNNNSYTPSRSYTPAASSGGGGGSSSGGGGGGGAVSRPGRGN
ncbi:MAG: hypothetical protein ABJB86_00095 [Bacteroidota bacterium]